MISVLICGAGKGTRAGFSENKLFRTLGGRTVVEQTVEAFSIPEIDEIVVTASPSDLERMKSLLPTCKIVEGGDSRSASVKKGLDAVTGDIVLIHDGARPFVTKKIILDCIACVRENGSGICSLPMTDTTVIASGTTITRIPDRSTLYTVQTPQGFFTAEIRRAYALAGDRTFTDDSSVYTHFISPAVLFHGDARNKKLTFQEDFMQETYLTGVGIDTHAFGKNQDYIVMGNVTVPSPSGLIAHSDGDVLIHAVMDALLSAAGLRDIGFYFPENDPAFEGADSGKLLEKVVSLLEENGCRVVNVSVAVQAQIPRLSPYIGQMKENLARIMKIPSNRVGITAGTNEGLGYIGEKKGITVTASAMIAQR
ncbi:MAG: 2-C-methyl-D-erythritol 2,4-cyclodiphosphate synthase [Clostridia bacterium]|nr:2-C-methyl-D-erythritol 2,4-cyclodiphosphate synthase [Clostridia bacterium]